MRPLSGFERFVAAFTGSLFFLCSGCSDGRDSAMRIEQDWTVRTDSLNEGLSGQWFLPEHPGTQWERSVLPPYNGRHDAGERNGITWYRTTFHAKRRDDSSRIVFYGSDNSADVWLNGVRVGGVKGYSAWFAADVTSSLRDGLNTLVVRVDDPLGYGGVYGPVSLTGTGTVNDALKGPYSGMSARTSADWVREALVYCAYPRAVSPDGTLRSLERRLAEIRSLGATVLWLLPVHPIGDANRKGPLGSPYAVQDYYAINPEYGTLEDFRSLIRSAHGLGLKVIMDLVINHTAWDSRLLFEHPEWFLHDRSGAIVSPTAEWSDVAALNLQHHELRKYIISMAEYWVRDVGVDGFRCDVAEHVPTAFWELLRGQLEKIKPVMLLSAGSLPEHHLKAFDVTYGGTLYRVLEAMVDGVATPEVFHESIRLETLNYPQGSLRLRYYTHHDLNAQAPAVARFGIKAVRLLSALVYTVPGIPLIYNGEEAGNTNRLDLFEPSSIDWTDRHGFRTLFESLGRMRREFGVFVNAPYRPVKNSEPSRVLSFARPGNRQVAVVVANVSADPVTVRVHWEELDAGEWKEINSGGDGRMGSDGSSTLPGWGWKIFIGSRTPT